jgi:hypothetical protein
LLVVRLLSAGDYMTSGRGGGFRLMTESNAERLATSLCSMRGAALKLGQADPLSTREIVPLVARVSFITGVKFVRCTLCRAQVCAGSRGIPLCMGFAQVLSIHDADILSPEVAKALDRVRHGADMMPSSQLEVRSSVLSTRLAR